MSGLGNHRIAVESSFKNAAKLTHLSESAVIRVVQSRSSKKDVLRSPGGLEAQLYLGEANDQLLVVVTNYHRGVVRVRDAWPVPKPHDDLSPRAALLQVLEVCGIPFFHEENLVLVALETPSAVELPHRLELPDPREPGDMEIRHLNEDLEGDQYFCVIAYAYDPDLVKKLVE